ncbi:MAG TPA: IS630 family transposase [Bryobacteraceae bacterium]|nr:IS630 family transposase [Bryobacteraceae bacterium]
MRVARLVKLDPEQRTVLEQYARARSMPARTVERARIVLRAAEGLQDQQIANQLRITPEKAARWRNRFLEGGLDALRKDAPRPGGPRTITDERIKQVVEKTTQEKPNNATHWSTRTMAAAVGLSEASIRRIWHFHGLKPHLVRTFKLSHDPQFAEKLEAIVGLYLNPPEHAIVLCADEKSQIQALDRTQPGLPLKKGRCGTMTHDYKRNGTATLFAALNTLDGTVISMCDDRHRHQEWLRFLRVIEELTPSDKVLHLIVDNYATHKHPKVQKWLARHRRFHVHFTPTSSSWLNMVERFFRDLTHNSLRRGVFRDVEELVTTISAYVDQHNHQPKPFIWTAKAADILEKVKRARKALDNRQSA